MFPKTSPLVKSYDDKTKWTFFMIIDAELMKKYTDVSIKVSNSIEIVVYCKTIYIIIFF